MHNHILLNTVFAFLLVLSTACNDSSTTNSSPAPLQSNAVTQNVNDGVVQITVLTDGSVLVNSETVEIESLGDKLDSISDIKEFWYYREDPDAAEPHENAMKVIAEIANHKLPVAMYLDSDFTQRVNFGN